ncbi:hypothetical protein SXM_0471 [Shewanella xiamenensis]|nr:hypothetical protein SXM_0471 [Shewanella xiamenensis]
MIGFSNGLANRNTIIGPKPARALSKPFKNGIVEQEQNGVIEPSKAAIKYLLPLRELKMDCTF